MDEFLSEAGKQLLLREEGEWFCRGGRLTTSTQWWYASNTAQDAVALCIIPTTATI